MSWDDKIKRINELYHKSKAEGLTQEEILAAYPLPRSLDFRMH